MPSMNCHSAMITSNFKFGLLRHDGNGIATATCSTQFQFRFVRDLYFSNGIGLRVLVPRSILSIGIDCGHVLFARRQEVEFQFRLMTVFVGRATNEPVFAVLCLTSHSQVVARFSLEPLPRS